MIDRGIDGLPYHEIQRSVGIINALHIVPPFQNPPDFSAEQIGPHVL
jgi:hypothetical protein